MRNGGNGDRRKLWWHDTRRFGYARLRPGKFKKLQNKRVEMIPRGYTYRSFDENRCIFVHIPKTAGVSIAGSLFGHLAGGHDPIDVYRLVFSAEEFYDYFKFAFVRNPWDRLLSAYKFLTRGGMSAADKAWASRNLSAFEDFDAFVKYGLRRKNILNAVHFVPQYRFLCSGRSMRMPVDFIGHYETLSEDFGYVKSKLGGVTDSELLRLNRNGSEQRRDYREFYTRQARSIVGQVYRRDIELFGYDFDGLQSARRSESP